MIKVMSSLDSVLPNLTDEGFDNDIPEERVAKCKKRKTLKDATQNEKVHFLQGKKMEMEY